ncbi:AI-2E family transporter [Spirochaetota bacterium]
MGQRDERHQPSRSTTFEFNFIKIGFYIFLLFIVLFAIYAVVPLLKAIIIAFIISYIINPVVTFFERKQVPRLWVIIAIFILSVLSLVFLILAVKRFFPTAYEISIIKATIFSNLDQLKDSLEAKSTLFDWQDIFNAISNKVEGGSNLTEKLPQILSSIASMVSLLLIIPFCIFFFLLNGREMKKGVLSLVPNKYFEMTLITLSEVDNIFGNYIRGTLLECFIIGTLASTGFYIIGFPLSIAFTAGMIAGLFNAIPYLGPFIGLILGLSICMLGLIPEDHTPFFGMHASYLKVVIVIIIVQLLDNVAVNPTVMGKSVNLHPLIVILGIMAGNSLFGFIGMLAAIPVIAILKVILESLFKQLSGFQFLSDNIVNVVSKHLAETK